VLEDLREQHVEGVPDADEQVELPVPAVHADGLGQAGRRGDAGHRLARHDEALAPRPRGGEGPAGVVVGADPGVQPGRALAGEGEGAERGGLAQIGRSCSRRPASRRWQTSAVSRTRVRGGVGGIHQRGQGDHRVVAETSQGCPDRRCSAATASCQRSTASRVLPGAAPRPPAPG
jgi:hypothetical protein